MPKKGAWTVVRFKGGGRLGKKLGLCVFEVWVVDTPIHTMDMVITLTVILIFADPNVLAVNLK